MNIGQLNKRITVSVSVPATDVDGYKTYSLSDPKVIWTETIPITTFTDAEKLRNGGISVQKAIKFRIRSKDWIKHNMVVTYKHGDYHIFDILDDPKNPNYMLLICKGDEKDG